MATLSFQGTVQETAAARPMVKGLFVATCLLSIVSFYTTERGMALYLSEWFAFLAALGVQVSLVLVAWLIGFTRSSRALLIAVYAITAVVSIAFSYVSLYTWFSAAERPASIERRLYDALADSGAKTENVLGSAIGEGQKHVLALRELTEAEKTHGHVSRAQDADPYLAAVREAVAREAATYASGYREGSGEGVRYSAFDRYAQMAEQSAQRMQTAQAALAGYRAGAKPLDASEQQLREFRKVYDTVPWKDVEQTLHSGEVARPPVPNYTDFVDRSSSGQEDLMIAFQELVTVPTSRHVFALLLAAFIDIIVFLLAFASGPYFFGSAEQRWISAAAAVDGLDGQLFVRNFMAKLTAHPRGMARADAGTLTPGEQQLCLMLVSRGHAITLEDSGRTFYLLDREVHERLFDALSSPGLRLRASAPSEARS